MSSVKYYRVTRYYGDTAAGSVVVMASNFIRAREEGEKKLPANVTHDAVLMSDSELTEYFAKEYENENNHHT